MFNIFRTLLIIPMNIALRVDHGNVVIISVIRKLVPNDVKYNYEVQLL